MAANAKPSGCATIFVLILALVAAWYARPLLIVAAVGGIAYAKREQLAPMWGRGGSGRAVIAATAATLVVIGNGGEVAWGTSPRPRGVRDVTI